MTLPGRMARLARWLGPWAPPTEAPPGIERTTARVDGSRAFDVWIYRDPAHPPEGSVLVVPGLHFRGPADPRFDRFSRVLAHAGFLVMAPFLPDYADMIVRPSVVDDAEAALDTLLARPERPAGKAGLFSISFGSMPALRVASRRAAEIERVLVFGGFSSFRRTLAFALRGDGARKNDPLNAPVVVLNLLPFLDVPRSDHAELARLFRAYCRASWGREEAKIPALHRAIAERVAAEAPEHLRELFLVATRARPGVEDLVAEASARAGDHYDWIDPTPHFGALHAPVMLVHGREDDVIPVEESHALRESLARAPGRSHPVDLVLTGLYGHTQGEGLGGGLHRLGDNARELAAMTQILRAMATLSG